MRIGLSSLGLLLALVSTGCSNFGTLSDSQSKGYLHYECRNPDGNKAGHVYLEKQGTQALLVFSMGLRFYGTYQTHHDIWIGNAKMNTSNIVFFIPQKGGASTIQMISQIDPEESEDYPHVQHLLEHQQLKVRDRKGVCTLRPTVTDIK